MGQTLTVTTTLAVNREQQQLLQQLQQQAVTVRLQHHCRQVQTSAATTIDDADELMEVDSRENNDFFEGQNQSNSSRSGSEENSSESVAYVQQEIDDPHTAIVQQQITGNEAKMLVVFDNGEQRLITFYVPNEDCTVQSLLDQANILLLHKPRISLVSDPALGINYIVDITKNTPYEEEKPTENVSTEMRTVSTAGQMKTTIKNNSNLPQGIMVENSLGVSKINQNSTLVIKSKNSKASSSNGNLQTKNSSTTNTTSKSADENKAPITRSKTVTTMSKTNITTASKRVKKRPAFSNTTSDTKRANLRTTMKQTVRPVRPAANNVSSLTKTLPTTGTATTKPSGPKPSKDKDLKGTKDMFENTSAKLKEQKSDIKIKSDLITSQQNEIDELKERLEKKEKENDLLQKLTQQLDSERRNLHNTIQELKGYIRVFCRVRPKIPKEEFKSTYAINYLDECTLEIGKAEGDHNKMRAQLQKFTFDKVFSPNSSQEEIFEELSMLVQSALEGYNVCVLAYGQTGSGKTYTMEGFPGTEEEGMIPKTVKHIFKQMKHFELLGWEYKIEASFLEIYNKEIVDLLDNNKKSHKIRMADSKGHDFYVSNLLVQEVHSLEEFNQSLLIAQQNRAMAATESNERSSRSHTVARIRLLGTHKLKQKRSIGNLNFVDLAGSERLKNEKAARIAKTKNINKSLENLDHVLLALLSKNEHIPYRNSKLTHLLKPLLGENSKTLVLLNISPLEESYNETLNSLRFGSKVNSCKTSTIKKEKSAL